MTETARGTFARRVRPHSNQLVALHPEADADLLAETLIAMANADGGTIYVGVAEDGRPTGYVYPEDVNEVVEQAELRCRPPILAEWNQTEIGGRFVFVGHVTRSRTLHTLEDGRVLVRTGAENRPLAGAQLQQVATTRATGDYEAEPVPGATRSDLDNEVLDEFIRVWQERQGRQLTRPLDDLLREMGWLLPNGQPTVAGILLFGKSPTTFIPKCGVTFVRFSGDRPQIEEGKARYGRRVEINGALAQVVHRTLEITTEEIHRGAVVQSVKREEQWIYPPPVIREALVNAVAHRDYSLSGRGVEIRMYSDKLEISSPGGLPGYITVDNIIEEHFSRNPRIVSGLYQWGYIEELGTGVDLMYHEMTSRGHPPPVFDATSSRVTVTFQAQQRRTPLPPSAANLTMNERQAKALSFVQKNDRIRSREYQELCPDVSPETLRLDLADLVERGVLLKIGRKRGTYYILK